MPHRSATKTQKTCSIECRQLRRNGQARRRRGRDLGTYRAAERVRQKASRAKRAGPVTVRMSRAGLSLKVGAVLGECLEKVDQGFRESRAVLERRLSGIVAGFSANPAGYGASPASQGEAGP